MRYYPIIGYDKYFASEMGDIYSSKSGAIRKKSQYYKRDYLYVRFSINGKRKNMLVNRLMALAFPKEINPNNMAHYHVDHVNGIKDDNRVFNLEAVTPRTNRIRSIELPVNKKHGINPHY